MKKNSFVEGTFIATFAIVLTKILGMIYVIPFYSIIGTQGGALYAYAYNVYLVFLGISTAGIPMSISKIISEYNTLEMYEARERSYKIGRNIMIIISTISFLLLFIFAEEFALLILGDIKGGNTIEDVAFVVRAVSFCLLVIPYLSITRGYLQGQKFITAPSISQVIEQIVRIFVILTGSFFVIKVLNGSLTVAVAISVFSAFIGGIFTYIYLKNVIIKNKSKFILKKDGQKDNIKSSDIAKTLIKYSIPFVVVSLASNIYALIDMVLMNRGFHYLGYDGPSTETITSIVTTWGAKIGMIVNAISIGLVTSLIPHIVSDFVNNNIVGVSHKINKALQIILIVSLPLVLIISMLNEPIYNIFYGESYYGPLILQILIFTSLAFNLQMVSVMALQGLNKFKTVYTSVTVGYLVNALLDVPLMILFNKIGLEAFYGAIVATLIGYSLTLIIALSKIKKDLNINYKSTQKVLLKLVFPLLIMFIILLVLNKITSFAEYNFIIRVMVVGIYSTIVLFIYLFILYKNKILNNVFGKEKIDKILIKLKLKKS